MPTRGLLAVLAAGACVASACTTNLADLTVATSKTVPLRPYVIARGVSGEDCTHSVLFVPLGRPAPELDRAIDRALAKVREGNVMTDVSVNRHTLVTGLWNRHCLRVRGTVGRIR